MIEVTIRLNDRVMADLVIFLEEYYKNCECPRKHSDIQVFFQDMARDVLLEHKVGKLMKQRVAERAELLRAKMTENPVMTLLEALAPPPMSDEDKKLIDQWQAEYEEE